MNSSRLRILLPLILIGILFTLLIILGRTTLYRLNVVPSLLLTANALLFCMSLLTFFLQERAMLNNSNPNVWIRSFMAAMMIRMFVFVLAVILYKTIAGDTFSRPSVFAALVIYMIYLAVEVTSIMKLSKHG